MIDEAPKIDKPDFGLTTEQLQNLLNFLNNHKENVPVTMHLDFEEPSCSANLAVANLAGKFCFLHTPITSKWIADSGSTDHICNSFIFTQKINNPKHNITIPVEEKWQLIFMRMLL